MSYAHPPSSSANRLVSLAAILGLHVGLVFLISSGLGSDVIKTVLKPVELRIIAEAPPPPPPPPPPKREIVRETVKSTPPPLYVPPPEVSVQAPVDAPALTTTSDPTPPPAIAAPSVPTPVAAPAQATPAVVSAGVACPNSAQVRAETRYPAAAQRRGISGDVLVEFTVTAQGTLDNVHVVGAANSLLAAAALESTHKFKCQSQGSAVRVQVPYSFKIS